MKIFGEIWERRFALRNLVLKNLRVRYRNMALGMLWSVLNPLVMLGVLVFVFSYVYPQPARPAFPIFVLIGLVHFNIFSRILAAATNSVVEHSALVKRVAFPRMIIPLAVVLSQLPDVLILVGLLGIFVALFHLPWTWMFLWVPVILLVELVFVTGMALLFSALDVYYRDMLYIVESGLTILFWMTPVFYPITYIHENLPRFCYDLYILNPLAGCVDATRRAILDHAPPDSDAFVAAIVVAVLTLVFGIYAFEKLQRKFADLA